MRAFALKCLRRRHSVLSHVVQQLLQPFISKPCIRLRIQRLSRFRITQRQRWRAEALAAQRAQRAQYLPEEDYSFESFGPRERAYLDTRRRQEVLENERRRREEEARVDSNWRS